MSEIFVYVDLQNTSHFVGRFWPLVRQGRESATFEYGDEWLANPLRFSLEPALKLGAGPQHTAADLVNFGALGDSAPDRWGRSLMRYAERRRAKTEGRPARTLNESDYLLLVDDEARQGALRFARTPGGPFLAEPQSRRIPPVIELPRLLAAANHVAAETDTDEELRLLLAPGSSLGGARPKAAVRENDGELAIAKFPHRNDEYDVELWEALALTLAEQAGISAPAWRVETIGKKPVLLLRRFDRVGPQRIPFLSAMSMLGARDHEPRSYLEIADALRQFGASPDADLEQLWRRVVFNVLISNTDDHLRNHAFLYAGGAGWRLAPVYDLNPVPVEFKPRMLSTSITFDSPEASLELALEVAEEFGIQPNKAKVIIKEVAAPIVQWRQGARRLRIPEKALPKMSSAFEHADLNMARAL